MKRTLATALSLFTIAVAAAQPFPPRGALRTGGAQTREQNDPGYQFQKFGQFFQLLNAAYVDTVDNKSLIENAITEVLSKLDPHSVYVTAEEMKSVNEQFDGSFSGIGVEFNVLKDTLIVVNTVVGGPAEMVGVAPNDRIVGIDSVSAIGITREQVPGKLRGPKGTVVNIEVVRRGAPRPLAFRIVRDDIPLNSVDAVYKPSAKVGYIRVNRFSRTTNDEMNEALDELGKVESLILDLRGNGGGLLDQAVDMASLFLRRGQAVVSTEGRAIPPERFGAMRDGRFTGRLTVLIDENSASASEIVAGAVQDWDRGIVIGRRSFGKGLVQRQFPLPDESSVRITVAHYKTPTGRLIQRPYELGHAREYYLSLYERLDQRGMDTIPGADSLRFKTLVRGRAVYGGGGIYPDIYIPADTAGYTEYWGNLIRSGAMNDFIIGYMDTDRTSLATLYPDFESFERGYSVTDRMFELLAQAGEKASVKRDPEAMSISRERLSLQIKALVAQRLWDTTGFYRVVNADDRAMRRAMELLASPDYLDRVWGE